MKIYPYFYLITTILFDMIILYQVFLKFQVVTDKNIKKKHTETYEKLDKKL